MLNASELLRGQVRLSAGHLARVLFIRCLARLVFDSAILLTVVCLIAPIISFLLECFPATILHLLRLQLNLRLLSIPSLILQIHLVDVCSLAFRWLDAQLELQEGVAVITEVPDHVLFEEEVVRGREMVVLVVFD